MNGGSRDGGGGDGGGGVQCQQPPRGGPWTQCPLSIVTDSWLVHYYDHSYVHSSGQISLLRIHDQLTYWYVAVQYYFLFAISSI